MTGFRTPGVIAGAGKSLLLYNSTPAPKLALRQPNIIYLRTVAHNNTILPILLLLVVLVLVVLVVLLFVVTL